MLEEELVQVPETVVGHIHIDPRSIQKETVRLKAKLAWRSITQKSSNEVIVQTPDADKRSTAGI